jgi:general secretion pathway protein C
MAIERSITNRFVLPQASAEWKQRGERALLILSKVPLARWQFLVRLLLVVSLSFTLARLFWLVFPKPSIPPAAIALSTATGPAVANGPAIDIAQLKSLSVFGKADAAAAQTAVPESQAVISQLNLVLVGIVSSSDESLARAIITVNGVNEIYAIGNTLPVGNSVTLAKVLNDKVILNNNGQFESLWLYPVDPNSQPIGQVYVPPSGAGQGQAWSQEGSGMAPPEMHTQYQPPSPPAPVEPRPENTAERGASGFNQATTSLSDVVAMSIYREGGQVVGYKIRPGRDVERFKSFGLQTDDIVTAVNGMPLTNPAKIMEVYKSMGNATSASLEIKRGGGVMTIDVVLQ